MINLQGQGQGQGRGEGSIEINLEVERERWYSVDVALRDITRSKKSTKKFQFRNIAWTQSKIEINLEVDRECWYFLTRMLKVFWRKILKFSCTNAKMFYREH